MMFSTGPFDRYQMCECDILKTNESILLQISKALHAARHKTINFRGYEVKGHWVTGGRS